MTEEIYSNSIGHIINITITEDGSVKDLTDATVKLYMKEQGTNTDLWSDGKTCTIDDATNGLAHYTTIDGDWPTVGMYYSKIIITYSGGEVKKWSGEIYEVIEYNKNIVTKNELIDFMDIPTETAKKTKTIESYLELAETTINLDFPALKNTTNTDYLKLKKQLIKLKGAITYFMNMDEGVINPNQRLPKIEAWKKEYNRMMEKFAELGGVSEGLVRKVEDTKRLTAWIERDWSD